ncbi:hypothetical protein [Cryobacterium sp. W22_MBD10_FK3]|uniref:hypothetical protein n=1 Tax=Cryobacterium sp. W22_MBD10_FK3 TaxID=3240273 RepID=UPI003F8EA1F8
MTTPEMARPTGRMRAARLVLVAVGVLGLGLGAYVMFDTVALRRLPGVVLWLGAAIVLHDAVISPLVFALGVLTRRAGHRVAGSIIVTVQAAIVVGSLMTLIVLPAVVAQGLEPKNPTILPLDYALNLGLFWLTLAVASVAVSAWFYLRTRRANQRPSRTQS